MRSPGPIKSLVFIIAALPAAAAWAISPHPDVSERAMEAVASDWAEPAADARKTGDPPKTTGAGAHPLFGYEPDAGEGTAWIEVPEHARKTPSESGAELPPKAGLTTGLAEDGFDGPLGAITLSLGWRGLFAKGQEDIPLPPERPKRAEAAAPTANTIPSANEKSGLGGVGLGVIPDPRIVALALAIMIGCWFLLRRRHKTA